MPAVKRAAKKGCASAVSATSGKGKIYWRLHEGSVNAEKPKEFVERLTYGKKRRVFLILDNAKTHRGKILSERAGKSKKRAALFYPPPYSHGSNSGERVNADVKYGGGIQDA
jgi:transposase